MRNTNDEIRNTVSGNAAGLSTEASAAGAKVGGLLQPPPYIPWEIISIELGKPLVLFSRNPRVHFYAGVKKATKRPSRLEIGGEKISRWK